MTSLRTSMPCAPASISTRTVSGEYSVILLGVPVQRAQERLEAREMDRVVTLNIVQASNHGAVVHAQGDRFGVGPPEGVRHRPTENVLSVADRTGMAGACS